ncbi:hypothetical protein XENOCAPTIV_025028 [Xenoophorus captivus]|uniref:Uncharacterized protein n=1 Tax=Xenoophorus captivus TaxID=1517983 RepID=A0ABV0S4H6_9TELE
MVTLTVIPHSQLDFFPCLSLFLHFLSFSLYFQCPKSKRFLALSNLSKFFMPFNKVFVFPLSSISSSVSVGFFFFRLDKSHPNTLATSLVSALVLLRDFPPSLLIFFWV